MQTVTVILMRENQSTMRGVYGSYWIDLRLLHYFQVWYHISLWFVCIFCLRLIACITLSLQCLWGIIIYVQLLQLYSTSSEFQGSIIAHHLMQYNNVAMNYQKYFYHRKFSMFFQFIFVQCPGSPVFNADFSNMFFYQILKFLFFSLLFWH